MASPYLNIPQPAPASGPPQQPAYNPHVKTAALATTSLVLGILSVIGFICFVSWALSFISIILGVLAIVQVGNSNGMLKGKGLAISGMALSVLSLGLSAALYVFAIGPDRSPTVISHLDRAERKIRSKSGDKIAFGNSQEAKELAEQFSERLSLLRKLGIEGGDSKKPSLSGGEFLTFCQLNEDSCAFLVHVPDLRNFDDGAKKFINDSAWSIAQQLLKDSTLPDGSDLAVATKGVLLYDEINIGTHMKELSEDSNPRTGIKRDTRSDSQLEPFFPPPTVIGERPATRSTSQNE